MKRATQSAEVATRGAEVMKRATQGADGANQNARSPAIARSHALAYNTRMSYFITVDNGVSVRA